jgi:hypothetical protein
MNKLMTVAALAALTACAAQANYEAFAAPPGYTEQAGPPARVSCNIRETRTERGLRLEAFAEADGTRTADYDFAIAAQSSSGASDVRQGGPVGLTPGNRVALGAAEIPGGRYRATLTLADNGVEICRLERRA